MYQKCFILLLAFTTCFSNVFQVPARQAEMPKNLPDIFTTNQPAASPTATPSASPEDLQVWLDQEVQVEQVHPRQAIPIRFNQPMNPDSATIPALTYPYIQGSCAWGENNTLLTFTPDTAFQPGQAYLMFLDQNLESRAGARFPSTPQWRLQVKSGPRVSGHKPTSPLVHQLKPAIQLTFDRLMDTASVAAALSVKPEVTFSLEWQDLTLNILPDQPLAAGVQYIFSLSTEAVDLQGIPLGEVYQWNVWPDPFQISIIHAGGYPVDHLALNFSYRMDTSSLPDFQVTPEISGTWRWVTASQASFSSAQSIPYGVEYLIKLPVTMRAEEGSLLPTPVTSLVFTSPAPIRANWPESQKEVSGNAPIWVTFIEPVDQASIERAFSVTPQVSGHLEWNGLRLNFIPDEKLAAGAYTIRLDTTARDLQGQPLLVEPYTWSFTVYQDYYNDWRERLASFGDYGTNLQELDANGRRALPLSIRQKDPLYLEFDLYPLELGDFVQSYRQDFGYISYYQEKTIALPESQPLAHWEMTTARSSQNYLNIQETIIPSEVLPGLYILDMQAEGKPADRLFVILTYNSLMVKREGDDLFVWVNQINGEGIANAEVRLYSSRGEKIRIGMTDENGLFRTSVPADYQALLVAARGPQGDFTLSGFEYMWNSNHSYWWWIDQSVPVTQYLAYIYTDRPIYQPGGTVYFKALLREDHDVRYNLLPENTPVTVRIRDPRDNVIQTLELRTNSFGSLNAEFQLASGAMLGDYDIEILVSGESHRQAFQVQDYRKPDYRLNISSEKERYVAGESLHLDISAQYYFGEPVANARITTAFYELRPNGWWWDAEAEDISSYTWYKTSGVPKSDTTDSNGNSTLDVIAWVTSSYSQSSWHSSIERNTMAVEVTADDGSHQTVSAYFIYQIYNSDRKIQLDTAGFFKKPGEAFTVQARVMDLENQPMQAIPLTLQLRGRSSNAWDFDQVILQQDLTSDAAGRANTSLKVEQSGYYQLHLTTRDGLRQEISFDRYIYLFSERDTWANRYASTLNIQAERDSYRPYDTARYIIESTFSGPALLTFERGSVIHSKPVQLTAPLTIVEAEVIPEDAPNVFVTINAWMPQDTQIKIQADTYYYNSLSDSHLEVSSTEIQVEPLGKLLEVTIETDQEVYSPRDIITITIHVADDQGQPMDAEVSLALVDEAIYALSGDNSPAIEKSFYGRRQHQVITYDSMAPYRLLYEPGGMGGGGGDELIAGSPRDNFRDTAAWFPVLRTDRSGNALVTLQLPDNLTSWRLSAKAITRNHRVGQAFTNITTTQAVILLPNLPRNLTDGDQVLLSTRLQNYSGASQEFAVALFSNRLEVGTAPTQTVQLEDGQSTWVSWAVVATGAGETQVTFRASGSSGIGDAVQLPLSIRPLSVPDIYTQAGDFTGNLTATLVMPDNALPVSHVQIRLSRSVAGSLLEGLEYLTGYPYGCVEQTMSRALPNAVVGRAFQQLGIQNPGLQSELPVLINAGLQKLYGMQHNDGGWGWWYDDDTNDYQTAWVVFGLAITAQAGYEVDPQVITRGADWLKTNLENMDIRTRAYALYSLAISGHGDLPEALALAENHTQLDTFSRAALALSLHVLGASQPASALLGYLIGTAHISPGSNGNQVYWIESYEDGHYRQKTMASSLRSTALALDALVQIDPQHALIPGIVRYLMAKRQTYGWGSTNETSFTIIALTDHLYNLELQAGDTEFQIELNHNQVLSGTLSAGNLGVRLDLPAARLQAGANLLSIVSSGDQSIYFTITHHLYLPLSQVDSAGTIRITRRYNEMNAGSQTGAPAPGTLMKVILTIVNDQDLSYVILEDMLPGGLEALNESLNTTSHIAALDECYDDCPPIYYWQKLGYNNKEVHADRVSFFITDLPKGSHTITYVARVTQPGVFVAMPAQASAMYDETQWGRSASDLFQVIDKEENTAVSGLGEAEGTTLLVRNPYLQARFEKER